MVVSMDGTALRKLREARSMSRMDVARVTGLSVQTILDLEHGARTNPRIGTLSAIADCYGVSVADLIGPDAEGAAA